VAKHGQEGRYYDEVITPSLGGKDEMRWSKWLESMRKDVECAFGILKGR